ncbi:MAG TPA: hypothetical protein DHW82_07750 [Spirochaetia bacterium]|nr:MAG: hypothetical protein A2Y41_11270 [Spirochaetes bacterium GWB1_36_13]HCL56888.1 hypothetical protein [Spirochaetia bacterium]
MKKYLRYSVVNFFILILFFVIFLRIFQLSLFQASAETVLENNQFQYMRGFIYSSERTHLAISLKTFSIYANPSLFNIEKSDDYRKLFQILKISKEKKEQVLNPEKRFVWLRRFIEKNDYEILEETNLLKLPGISSIKEYKRVYPQNETASQTIGFVSLDGEGLAGIEYSMNHLLKASNDFLPLWEKENILGNDIVLTLNIILQKAVETLIAEAYQNTKAKNITAVIMEASSGDILALVNTPTFDPNFFYNYSNTEIFKNNAVSYIDEPGSTFKPLVMSFLLQDHKITEDEKFNCKGQEMISGFLIRDERVHGMVNPRKIITYSCNIGMALASQTLKKQELYQILLNYGLGAKTGLPVAGEEKGIIRVPEKMTSRSKLSIPIGQEIGLTPIQLVTAYTAIGNHGILMKPRLIKSIEYNGKVIQDFPPEKVKQILRPEISETILSYMRDVVTSGTGRDANIPGVFVAGKTGTAQVFDNHLQVYSKVNTSFIALLKHPNGKTYILYAVIRNPSVKEASGGKLAAPLVKNMGLKLLEIIQ